MTPASGGPAIETRGLTKSYGTSRGIEDLSIRVERGQVFGFLGPNGAGKSTTIRALVGLQRPSAGSVSVLGLDAWRESIEVHRQVGYLPGELRLFDRMSGRQHIDWLARARRIAADAVAKGLAERLELELDRPVEHLSKGNRQKLGIVLALMHRPQLLVLDEPSSGLDPLMQDVFHELLREAAAEGRTVFLSSHELDEVQRVADQLAIIRDGRLVLTDSVEHLRQSAPQRFEFRTSRAVDPAALESITGVHGVRVEGDRVELEFAGTVGPLLRAVAELDPHDFVARQADLEELFRQYYRPNGSDHAD